MPTPRPAAMSHRELSEALRTAILQGELVPRQRLVEADIAERYGVSRGTIRTSLSDLDGEGLIERSPNRGAKVREVSVAEAVEITEVRGAVEALCARKAAERITDEQVGRLQELGQSMRDAVERDDRRAYSEGNRRLHATVIEISGQRTAARTIERLRGQAVRYQFQLSQQPGRPSVSLPQHLAIIDAVCARDPEAAARAMNEHLRSVADTIRGEAAEGSPGDARA